MPPNVISIVDPTLQDKTGHCYSFLTAFLDAREVSHPDTTVNVYACRNARGLLRERCGVTLIPYFIRPLRKLQTPLLYRKLLRAERTLFIPTATRTDLFFLAIFAGKDLKPGRVTAFIHWFRNTEKRHKQLTKLASKCADIQILTPCESVYDLFRECGFHNCRLTEYPMTAPVADQAPQEFRKVAYAGAARRDKGFPHVSRYVQFLSDKSLDIPAWIQASHPHSGKHPMDIQKAINKLQNLNYPALKLLTSTLSEEEYTGLFNGAICLQLYDPEEFHDRVSGVTLDALAQGAPIIALQGSWSAAVVEKYKAGLVIKKPDPESIHRAVENIRTDYKTFSRAALKAGRTLGREHDAKDIFNAVRRTTS